MMGVVVQRVAEISSLDAESYQMAGTAPSNLPRTPQVSLVRSHFEAAPGSYYISMNQPLAFVAAAALEPDTPYSFYSTGILNQLNEVMRVVSTPQIVFEEE